MNMIFINNIRKRFIDALNDVKVGLRKGRVRRDQNLTPPFKARFKLPLKKDPLGQKRSISKAKGNVNTDTKIFNKSRKDEPHGRQN